MTPALLPSQPTPRTTGASDEALFGRRTDGARDGRRDDARTRFAEVLGERVSRPDEAPETQARRAAESFVAMTFVQPLLTQLRETNNAAPPFAPTPGEKQFQGLADAELAQRIVSRANWPLVDRIAGDLLKHAQRSAAADASTTNPGSPAR